MTDDPHEWRRRATCRNHPHPDLWYPAKLTSPAAVKAKGICQGCPVRRTCGDDAVDADMRVGIFGGFNTAVTAEWIELHKWLGRPAPVVAKQTCKVCACGAEFSTRREDLARCPQCAQGLVPSRAARSHIEQLARTLSHKEISHRAGLGSTTAYSVMRQKWIQRETERALLAVTLDDEGVVAP